MRKWGSAILMILLLSPVYSHGQHKRAKRSKTHTSGSRVHRTHLQAGASLATPVSPEPQAPNIAIPPERGRTVMQEQISNSGSVIATPVPKPRKVVVVPAPPPPGNTMTATPRKR